MASRRSRTTRPLFAQVALALEALQVPLAVVGNPTTFGLVARYVTGLIVLDARPTQRRISAALPARGHDILNRLRRIEALMQLRLRDPQVELELQAALRIPAALKR